MKLNNAATLRSEHKLVNLVLLVALVTNCAQYSAFALPQAQKTDPTTPVKIQLNLNDAGTSDDASTLSNELADVFKRRKENRAYKPGMERRTDLPEDKRIEKTVFVKADRSIKLADITKVIETLEDAGAEPVLLPIQLKGAKADWMGMRTGKPNPLTLLVRLKEPNSPVSLDASGLPSINDLLILEGLPIFLSSAAKQESLAVITVPRDGEFTLSERHIPKTALEIEMRNRIKTRSASEKVVFIKAGPDISYGSLEDIYQAAFAAGAKRIDLDIGERTIAWDEQGMRFTFPAGWRKRRIDSETFDLRGPDGSRLSVDVLDRQGDVMPDVNNGYEDLVREQKKGTYDEVRIMEVDGAKGLLSRWSGGEFDPDSTHLRWQAFRMRKGKLQYIQINIRIPIDFFNKRKEELDGILNSLKLIQK